jgi:outer membrane receptor protein involved in Fe transport
MGGDRVKHTGLLAAASAAALSTAMIATAAPAQVGSGQEAPPEPDQPQRNAQLAHAAGHCSDPGNRNGQQMDSSQSAPPVTESTSVSTKDEPDIIVTGSRIQAAGYTAPTPVTVVDEAIILRDARPTIGDSIRELPAVGRVGVSEQHVGRRQHRGGRHRPRHGQSAQPGRDPHPGAVRRPACGSVERHGPDRHRHDPDRARQPHRRGDGGRVAAWGSDAVAGVVNLILNKQFEGFRASAEYGDTFKFDRKQYRFQAAAGTGFNDDRGRVIVAGNFFERPSRSSPISGRGIGIASWSTIRPSPPATVSRG